MVAAQAVSRTLGKAGHRKSVSRGTRIRGYRSASRGYIAEQYGDTVTVEHTEGSGMLTSDRAEKTNRAIEDYAATLRAAGYTVVEEPLYGTHNPTLRLRVTGRKI